MGYNLAFLQHQPLFSGLDFTYATLLCLSTTLLLLRTICLTNKFLYCLSFLKLHYLRDQPTFLQCTITGIGPHFLLSLGLDLDEHI